MFAEFQRPGELRVDIEREHTRCVGGANDIGRLKAVKAHQPVGLIEPVLAHQRRALEGKHSACVRNGRESRVIDPPEREPFVKPACAHHDVAVVRTVGAHDHLGRLPGRCKGGGGFEAFGGILAVNNGRLHPAHGAFDARCVLFGRKPLQACFRWKLDVDRNAIGVAAGLVDQFPIGIGIGLEVNIATKFMIFSQAPCHLDDLLHRVVG